MKVTLSGTEFSGFTFELPTDSSLPITDSEIIEEMRNRLLKLTGETGMSIAHNLFEQIIFGIDRKEDIIYVYTKYKLSDSPTSMRRKMKTDPIY